MPKPRQPISEVEHFQAYHYIQRRLLATNPGRFHVKYEARAAFAHIPSGGDDALRQLNDWCDSHLDAEQYTRLRAALRQIAYRRSPANRVRRYERVKISTQTLLDLKFIAMHAHQNVPTPRLGKFIDKNGEPNVEVLLDLMIKDYIQHRSDEKLERLIGRAPSGSKAEVQRRARRVKEMKTRLRT